MLAGIRRSGPVLCCPDKFRGSLTAAEAADALAAGVERTGRATVRLPLADGGEGTLDVLCPATTTAAPRGSAARSASRSTPSGACAATRP